jgi:hypothetical protein
MKRFLSLANGQKAFRTAAALALLGVASTAFGADHRDGGSVKLPENIASDINDVYTFVSAGKVVLAMTVFPAADANSKFDPATVYVFHVNKHVLFPAPSAGSTDVLCTFNAEGNISCWFEDSVDGTKDYVTGDASDDSGLVSESGKFKVFAGLRTDPFYFYLDGFNAARDAVFTTFTAAFPTLNGNGCPVITTQVGAALRGLLVAPDQTSDFFRSLNGLAIVIEADPDLFVDDTNKIITVFASTHVTN